MNEQSSPDFQQKTSQWFTPERWAWLLITIGIVLRFVQYQSNRSLWMDESFLALNLVNRSLPQLFRPLDYVQSAPIGFLITEKAVIKLLGDSEYTFRLFPFIAGIGSLILFYQVARRCLSQGSILIALTLFVTSTHVIYYSSELKQYSTDIAITLLIYLWALRLQAKPALTAPDIALSGLLGAIVVWWSHPAIFVLAGVGSCFWLQTLLKRDRVRLAWLSLAFIPWGLSFAIQYMLSMKHLSQVGWFVNFWADGMLPLLPKSMGDILQWAKVLLEAFDNPGGLTLTGLAAFLFATGCVYLYRQHHIVILLIISPILVALLASGLHKYPFKTRLIMFLVPALLLVVAEGTWLIYQAVQPISRVLGIVLIGLLLFYPVTSALSTLKSPTQRSEVRPVMHYIQQHWKPGDFLYVYYASHPQFNYYNRQFQFAQADYYIGTWPPGDFGNHQDQTTWNKFIADIPNLKEHSRVWLLFSQVPQRNKESFRLDEELFMLYNLDQQGRQLDAIRQERASAYLYDLSQTSRSNK